jgi:CBS domain-containing protein
MSSHVQQAARGRDLAILTLEIAEASGAMRTIDSVLCPKEQRTKPVEECRPCIDSLGEVKDPTSSKEYLECVGTEGKRPAPQRGPADPDPSLADRTPITQVMTPNVVALRAELALDRACALFRERGICGAPVVDADGRPIGVLSTENLLRYQADLVDLRVADAMTRSVQAVPENAPVSEVAALMAFEKLERVPVVSRGGRVVGVVTALDLVRWLAQQDGFLLPAGSSLQGR